LKLLYEGVIEEGFISDIVHAACSLCNIPFLIERASLGASSRLQKYAYFLKSKVFCRQFVAVELEENAKWIASRPKMKLLAYNFMLMNSFAFRSL
jgi:hypothetical protein